ncbi:MAG: glycosyltransferase family 4 protein [Verrucomicrobiia bacterium]
MRIAWLAPYPEPFLEPHLKVARKVAAFHPCSWIVNLSRALARRDGIELHLVTESRLVPEDQVIKVDNITFHVLKSSITFTNRGFPPWLPLDVLTGFKWTVRRLVKEVGRIRPDLVHTHGTERAYGLAGVASGFPCLVSIQGIITEYYKTNPTFGSRVIRHWEQEVVRKAKFFTCRTHFDTGFVRAFNPSARIFMIHEAMSPVFFANQWSVADSRRILFVGLLAKRKGLATLLEALALVRAQLPGVCLDVIGSSDAGYSKGLRAICERLGIEQCVTFLGQRSAEEIAQQHLQTQLFVLPSENENSPNALAEAMVSGMPVIATNVGGIPSMVTDGETGLLVQPRNSQALAEKIVWLLTHPEERRRLGENARRVARDWHAPEQVAAETLKAYREILNSSGSPARI